MFRVWGRLFKENRLVKDHTTVNEEKDTRTHKVFQAMNELCCEFDLGEPIWLNINIEEFRRDARTRFYRDSFIEDIDFDYFEFYVIEEDDY
ncbi:MAG: hypothetical protein ACK5ML_02925 [Lachnospiraceae bacterium]